ncbi:hypothetical protein LguiA_029021 [Lonicera macranthoides]
MVDFVEEKPIDLRKEEESDDLLEQMVPQGYTLDDEVNPRVMSFEERIPTISPETTEVEVEFLCGTGLAWVVVRGSGSFDDNPFLGRLCCAAIDKFNRVNVGML